MKTIIIMLFVLFADIKLQAQAFKTYADTANYLISQIENKKSQYIGEPFSKLYDSLKIKPVYVITEDPNIKTTFGRKLIFYFNYERIFEKKHYIIIKWDNAPTYNTLYPLLFPGVDQPINMPTIINLYKPLIVKDIILKDYSEDDPINPNVMQQQE